MKTDKEIDEADHTLPSTNGSAWPPPPSNGLEIQEHDAEPVLQFFVGILTGFGYYLFSNIFYAFSLVVFWQLAQSNVHLSRWLAHDLPTNLFGRGLLIVGFFSCNAPGILRFARFRTHQPRYAWGIVSGSCFTMLTWFMLSWYINQAYPTI